jgi:hypothetical protein
LKCRIDFRRLANAAGGRFSWRTQSGPTQRFSADFRRLLHYNEAGALEMLHEAFCNNLRHDLVGVVRALAALEAQGDGERVGEVAWVGDTQAIVVGS